MSKIFNLLFVCLLALPIMLYAAAPDDMLSVDTGVTVTSVRESANHISVQYEVSEGALASWRDDEAVPAITRWIALPDAGEPTIRVTSLQSNEIDHVSKNTNEEWFRTNSTDFISLGSEWNM